MTPKIKYTTSNLKPWKENLLAKVKKEATVFKQKIKPKHTKLALSNPNIKKYLEELHLKFVIVTIDKASSNLAFICRKYYISNLLAVVSPNKNKNSTSTYSRTQKSKE